MKNLRNLRVYNKLQKAFNTAKLINEEVTAEKRPYKRADAPPAKEEYVDKSAVIANIKSVKKNTDRENSFIIEGALKITKKAEEQFKQMEMNIDNIVVDLTKLKTELEKYNSSKSDDVEELKKVLRYFVTYKNQTDKAIQEAESKREKAMQKLKQEGYYEELDRLEAEHQRKLDAVEDKYDKSELRSANMEASEKIEKQKKGMKKIQEEHLAEIRKIRQIITDTIDLPIDILQNVSIYAMSLGALASLSKNPDRLKVSKEGIDKILNSPTLKKELGEFIETIEFEDSVQVVGSKLPPLGTYYSELKTKYETEMLEFEDAKGKVDEGVFSDIVKDSVKKIMSAFKKFFATAKSVLSSNIKQIEENTNSITSNMEDMKLKNAEFKSRFSKMAIQINSDIKKVQYETSKQTADEVQ